MPRRARRRPEGATNSLDGTETKSRGAHQLIAADDLLPRDDSGVTIATGQLANLLEIALHFVR